jgi:uncharacterized protein (TIRG00374 family)
VRRRWLWILGWTVLTALIVATARRVDAMGTLRELARADIRWIALAVLVNAAILPVATTQWLLFLARESRVGFRKMFGILALTTALSNGPPFPTALVTQIHLLAHRGGIGHAGAASLVLLDQIVEGLAKLSVVALAAAIVPGFRHRGVGLALVLGVPAVAVVVVLLAHRRHVVERFGATATGWRQRAIRFLARVIHHLDAVRRPEPFVLALLLGLVKKALEAAGIWAAAAALGLTLPFWLLVAVLVAVNLSVIIAPTPAALGIWEGAAFLVLRSAGVEADQALAVALVAHAAYLLPLVSVGWILESFRLVGGLRRRTPSGRDERT